MLKSKRAVAAALAGLGLMAAADLPTDIQAVPAATLPVTAEAQSALPVDTIEYEAPLFGDSVEADVSLRTLVDRVADYGDVELDEEMRCLASAVYNEARGEPLEGQLAVAQVVLNRADDSRWPDTLCAVVYQRYQFSFTFDGKPDFPTHNRATWQRAKAVAIVAATDTWEDVTDEAVFFHADYVNPKWRSAFHRTSTIGRHIFYR
ncbi:MAG: cell wall hydrolase [Pacificimonas sp.]|jgi:hypothetical protein|nr:cell wall hydrolase [Pacificimonas sp.]